MRRWLVALGCIVLLLGLGLGLAAYNLDAYLNANRDAIAGEVSRALGREVAFGEVGVSLRGGLGVRVADLAIGDDPAFSKDSFLTAGALEVRVKVLPALRGRIEVDRVVLRSPAITVIRTARGLSTESLGRGAAEPAPAPSPEESSAPGALLVALVDIEDGTIRFVDRTSRPPVENALDHLDFRASDVVLGAPVRFELEAAVLGATRQNLRARGRVGVAEPADPTVDVEFELDPLDLAKALASPPFAGSVPSALAGSGTGRIVLRASGSASDLSIEAGVDARDADLRIGEGFTKPRGRPFSLSLAGRRRGDALEIASGEVVLGDTRLTLRGAVESLASPRVRLEVSSPALQPASFGAGAGAEGDVLRDLALTMQLSFPTSGPRIAADLRSKAGSLHGVEYGDLALDARMDRGRVDVAKLALACFGGSVAASGSADLRAPTAPSFDGRMELQGASLESLLAAGGSSGPSRATGRLDARFAVRGAGAGWEAIAPTLAGGGELNVVDGVLYGFNPAGDALRALVELPVLSGRRLGRVVQSHPQLFGVEDTPFERIDARFDIAGGELVARDAQLLARDYSVTGKGRYAFAGRLDSSAVMAFSPELSDEVVDAEKKLRFLRSSDGRVEFPVVIRGTPGDIDVTPDLAYVASNASRGALTDVVERALVGKHGAVDESAEGAAAPPGEAPPPASLEDAGRDLLHRGLGGLLGGKRRE